MSTESFRELRSEALRVQPLLLLLLATTLFSTTESAAQVDSDPPGSFVEAFDPGSALTSDLGVNPATLYPTGFVLSDGLPSLFRGFAPGHRHLVLLNPARMADTPGYLVSEYLPAAGPQVGISLVAGRDASWLVSIIGRRSTSDRSTVSSLNSPNDVADDESAELSSITSSTLRVSRLVRRAGPSEWSAAVGIRLGLQRDDDSQSNVLAARSSDATGQLAEARYRLIETNTNTLYLQDNALLRAGLEVGLYNGRTDILIALQMDYETRDRQTVLEQTLVRTDSMSLDNDPLAFLDRTTTVDEYRSSRQSELPGYSAGVSVRSLVAKRGGAEHHVMVEAGGSLTPGTTDLSIFQKNATSQMRYRDGLLETSSELGDSSSVASTGEPINRDIFAQAAYVHRQSVGSVDISTGIGATTWFNLARTGRMVVADGSVGKTRNLTNRIDWLVPAFVNYRASSAISVFGGVVFDLEYNWSTERLGHGPPQNRSESSESSSGALSAVYQVGAMVDQAGFYGQVGFAGNLTDYASWQITLGLDL